MNTNLIGIAGAIGSGKDTVGAMIRDFTADTYEIKKFATKLKQMASLLTGIPANLFENQEFKKLPLPQEWWHRMKDGSLEAMTVRQLLQRLGTEGVREAVHTNAWVNALFADHNPKSRWVITDVRYPNEAEAIRERGGVLLKINRPGFEGDGHKSERSLDNYAFDYTLNNSGDLKLLRASVLDFLNWLTEDY